MASRLGTGSFAAQDLPRTLEFQRNRKEVSFVQGLHAANHARRPLKPDDVRETSDRVGCPVVRRTAASGEEQECPRPQVEVARSRSLTANPERAVLVSGT